jgi:hypothetical protein
VYYTLALKRPAYEEGAGDHGGNIYFVELVGIECGPIIVTAVDFRDGPKVRCPFCLEYVPLEEGWPGQVINCPQPAYAGRLRVNPFIDKIQRPPWAKPLLPEGALASGRRPSWRFWRGGSKRMASEA